MQNWLWVVLSLWFSLPSAASSATISKAQLQAAMQIHLDEMSVEGAIIHLDSQTGDFLELYATESHPMVFQIDTHYVLCAELFSAAGERRTIDVYITEDQGTFKVTQTLIDNRSTLKVLMGNGRAKRLK